MPAVDRLSLRRYNLSLMGVDVSRWMPQSSKLVIGCAEQAMVGSTPMHSRCISETERKRLAPTPPTRKQAPEKPLYAQDNQIALHLAVIIEFPSRAALQIRADIVDRQVILELLRPDAPTHLVCWSQFRV